MKNLYTLLVCIPFLLGAEEPFGQDVDLMHPRVSMPKKTSLPLGKKIARSLIAFHQDVISPADGPRSHYYPSSSEYTKQAILKYGFVCGFLLGCDRLMRENNDPWLYRTIQGADKMSLKLNPVPNLK